MKNSLRIGFVEDEDKNIGLIRLMLDRYGHPYEIIGIAKNVQDATSLLRVEDCDLFFCDIQLKDGTIFEALDQEEVGHAQLIFVTAFSTFENALRAIRLSCLDFITKPVDYVEFSDMMDRVLLNESTDYEDRLNVLLELVRRPRNKTEKIGIIQARGIVRFILIDQISHILADDSICHIVMNDERKITSTKNMGYYSSLFPSHSPIFQIHKSTLINLNEVDRLDSRNRLVYMKSGEELQVAKRSMASVRDRLLRK